MLAFRVHPFIDSVTFALDSRFHTLAGPSIAAMSLQHYHNAITHYRTSFRIESDNADVFMRLKANVYGWLLDKEPDQRLRNEKSAFFHKSDLLNLYNTYSRITTATFHHPDNEAWALRYSHPDGKLGRKRFWFCDIGIAKRHGSTIVSVCLSYAWNTEYLDAEREEPSPSVPNVLRYILRGSKAYSGRPEFRLLESPIKFKEVGVGQALCEFIKSPERRYPLIVFCGDEELQVTEANKLARELTGKCQVAIISSSPELIEEFEHFMPEEFRVRQGQLRVYFPFGHSNNPLRHRWYWTSSAEYRELRAGIISGLLRHHALEETDAVETLQDVEKHIGREKLKRLTAANDGTSKDLEAFYAFHAELEKDWQDAKLQAQTWAAECDQKDAEITAINWKLANLEEQVAKLVLQVPALPIDQIMPKLPSVLADVVGAAQLFYRNLVFTDDAIRSASGYDHCKSVAEAWEMLRGLNCDLYDLKFKIGRTVDLESEFKNATGYELAMSEGRNTKRDKGLMKLRKIDYEGRKYDITPHIKHGNSEPKMLRIHFAFDEKNKRIVVGYVGPHMANATSKKI